MSAQDMGFSLAFLLLRGTKKTKHHWFVFCGVSSNQSNIHFVLKHLSYFMALVDRCA